MDTEFIIKILDKCESECGQFINTALLCEYLKISVRENMIEGQTLCGRFFCDDPEDKNSQLFIDLKANLSEREKNTVCVLLIAEYLLSPNRIKQTGCVVEVFDIREMRKERFSRMMYLATRLALPESEIEKIDSNDLNKPAIEALNHFNDDLINSAVRGHSVGLLLGVK